MAIRSGVNVALVHPFDPRGAKVGGVETFVRDYITFFPKDMHLLMIGVDGFGDLPLGEISEIEVRGRTLSFLPLVHLPDTQTNQYAGKLAESLTLRFVGAALKNFGKLNKLLNGGNYSLDLRRTELAPIAMMFRRPSVQMLHDGMFKGAPMNSLLRKFWWVKGLSERFSLRHASAFYCVNQDLTDRLKQEHPSQAHKLGTLPTWANPTIFAPSPFPVASDTINIGFTGRMDNFKRPDLMFQLVAKAHAIDNRVRFHYVGDGDVEQFAEFDAIRHVTVLHGRTSSEGLAKVLQTLHVGLLTSDFEGMPRSVMELLASGRPVVALHLPQLELVIHDGQSGYLIPRGEDQLDVMAGRVIDTYRAIEAGSITPDKVAAAVADFGAERLLGRLYNDHRRIHKKEI